MSNKKYRIVCLGDTHGRKNWVNIVKKELKSSDKIIFVGDYFDTHDNVSAKKQISNFKKIIEFKKKNSDKVILLIGNHDFHYLKGIRETYSGYQSVNAMDIRELLHSVLDIGLMQMCYVYGKYVFTHAGVTKTWCSDSGINIDNLEESINDLFKYKPYHFTFNMGGNLSQTGDDVTQGPIWVRPASLMSDMLDNIVCVVGHTTVKSLGLNEKYPIILIDCLGTSGEYLVIENDIPKIEK